MTSFESAHVDDATDIALLINQAYAGQEASISGWTGVAHLLGGPRITEAQVAAWIQAQPPVIWVARESSTLVGCVRLVHLRPHVGEISLLAIRPSRQRGGLGRRMLAEAERTLKQQWHCQIAELTVLSPRPELEAWYERRGYRLTGRRRPLRPDGEGYGEPRRGALELVEYSRPLV